jgi:hypothetical protein
MVEYLAWLGYGVRGTGIREKGSNSKDERSTASSSRLLLILVPSSFEKAIEH